MKNSFSVYPQLWGLKQPDHNIDHRRVPNLMTFFTRKGKALPVSQQSDDYQPGDMVTWRLPNGRLHIGLVILEKAHWGLSKRRLILHNIGAGARKEDILFEYDIVGHYRYF